MKVLLDLFNNFLISLDSGSVFFGMVFTWFTYFSFSLIDFFLDQKKNEKK